jgi:Rod binding domain-containing protein
MESINMSNLYASEVYKTYSSRGDQVRVETRAQEIDRGSKLYKACQDFEAIFVKQMLNVMRKTVQKTGLMDGGFAEEVFEDMLYDEYAQKMTENAQFGLSDTMYNQLSRFSAE